MSWISTWRERRLAKKRDRIYWQLRDARDDHSSWAFGRSPSRNHQNEVKIERLEAKLNEMDREMGLHVD